MKMSERNMEICKLIEQGFRSTVLAAKYDISRPRVYQIYKAYLARKIEEEASPPLKKLLIARMRKALLVIFKDESIYTDPARIMSIKLRDYSKVQHVGKYALDSLVKGMLTLGYVKKVDEWLEGYNFK